MDEKITDKTLDFIRGNHAAGKPFFAYVGFTNVHPPMIPHPDFAEATDSLKVAPGHRRARLDRAGQILDLLDELGISDLTTPSWCGPATTPLPGCWLSRWGRRLLGAGASVAAGKAPCARRPSRAGLATSPRVAVTDEIVAAYDWMPTLAALIGESDRMPTDRPIDGMDMSSFLSGETEESGRDTFLLHRHRRSSPSAPSGRR